MTDHGQFREMIEAYALGSLDSPERATLEAHLASGCTECSAALDEARSLVSQLAYLAPAAAPSDILRGRLMQTVRAESRSQAKARTPLWMWAAVAAAVILTVASVVEMSVMHQQVRDANARMATLLEHQRQLEHEFLTAKRQAVIMTDPNSQTFLLNASERDWPQMRAMWHEEYGLCVMGHGIPMPKDNHTLELWLMPKDPRSKPMPLMTLRPDQNGGFCMVVARPPEDMHETKWLAITEEPAGGSAEPTSAPMWMGSVS